MYVHTLFISTVNGKKNDKNVLYIINRGGTGCAKQFYKFLNVLLKNCFINFKFHFKTNIIGNTDSI